MLKLSEKSSGQTGTKILLEAISKDKVHLARFILDALDGEIIDSKTDGAPTPLTSSVLLPDTRARSKFINLLLQRGASVNCQDESGRTALSYACEKGYLDAVKILVQNNADPELVDIWGNTALMYAAVAGHSSVVDFLVRAFKRLGLQIDRQNKVGNSAVEVAKYLGHQDCLFALTNKAKKSHESVTSTRGESDSSVDEDKLGRKLSDGLDPQSKDHVKAEGESAGAMDEVYIAGVPGRRRSSILRCRLLSMDSIEEFEAEGDSTPSSPGVVYSGVLAPKTLTRPLNNQYGISKIKRGEKSNNDHFNLPPLPGSSDNQFPVFFSPRPAKNASKHCTSACTGPSSTSPLTSPLGILLTPIVGNKVSKEESDNEKFKKTAPEFGIRRFDDSYYQKRCSLPTSILSPVPPDRSLKPLRKSKTVLKNLPLAANETTNSNASGASTSFTVLGNKLLRRFTFPEFKKTGKDLRGDVSADALSGSPELAVRGIQKSDTFPLIKRHPQVGSKPSIDSISAVKCEFDFQFKATQS